MLRTILKGIWKIAQAVLSFFIHSIKIAWRNRQAKQRMLAIEYERHRQIAGDAAAASYGSRQGNAQFDKQREFNRRREETLRKYPSRATAELERFYFGKRRKKRN